MGAYLGAAYWAIYSGAWNQDQIDAYNETVLENIHTAVAALMETGVNLVLSNVIDHAVPALVQLPNSSAAGRQRIADRGTITYGAGNTVSAIDFWYPYGWADDHEDDDTANLHGATPWQAIGDWETTNNIP